MSSPNAASPERLLLVDDTPANLSVLAATLEPRGFEILAVSDGATALHVAERARPDLILLDIIMPEMDGFETCRRLKQSEATKDIPVIFITARGETEHIVAGFAAGGVDYVVKPFEAAEVVSRVNTHLRLGRLCRELLEKNRALEARTTELISEMEKRRQVESALRQADEKLAVISDLESSRWNLHAMIGGSPQMQRIVEDISRLRHFSTTSVLITGESGTGKELIARAIHFDGARAKAPFVAVNCAAIPAELAESMLFGHAKGAFTGAASTRKGFFEMASGGTIFLDEIGDMALPLQAKLLRVLEDSLVTPVGMSEPVKVDVRVIAASNAKLTERIVTGTFRQDLYFRLARYTVCAPPLRERLEDIDLLAHHFLRVFSAEMGMKVPPLSDDALQALKAYHFPGNVRELRNIIERALIECGETAIQPRHLRFMNRDAPSPPPVTNGTTSAPASVLPLNLAEAEDALIQRALQKTGGNIADAARLLGVHRTRIYRKLAQEGTRSPRV
ncbi:MAG: sigma-54-dependent transcriptional regulator [Limisphaerales bacterium]